MFGNPESRMRAVALFFCLDVVYLFIGGIQGCSDENNSDKKDIAQQQHIDLKKRGGGL
jgi:hypothetical protein